MFKDLLNSTIYLSLEEYSVFPERENIERSQFSLSVLEYFLPGTVMKVN